MAGERTLPGLGLRAFWNVGSHAWEQQHDPDTRKLSVLCQAVALSMTTALPGAPVGNPVYIVPDGATSNENEIAAWDAGAWVYFPPSEGWMVYLVDSAKFVFWDGTAWADVVSDAAPSLTVSTKTANYTLLLADAGAYVRMNVAAANTLTIPDNATAAFPLGSVIQIRQVGAGKTSVVGAAGVTVNTPETASLRKTGSTAAVIKVGVNEWDLTGDLETL